MSLNDRLRIVVNEFFHGNKAALLEPQKISDQRAYSCLSVRVIQNLRLEFWRI